ncbi:unnamed protein product [Nesidiocoris tenuis]|uniref:Uncharacterized protein n=1 Tax=Nesidiocoris tenuis TaxID=355587 RepID=A0A6H5H327_9HEMI|nr:unnamed protein product [Nesidiocoris tenuis]
MNLCNRHDDTLEGSGEGSMLSPHRSYPTAESPVPGGASGASTPQPSSPQTLADKLGVHPSGSEQPVSPEKTEKPACTPNQNASTEPSSSEVHVATSTAEMALVDPSEVVISSRDVLTAEPVLTPLGQKKNHTHGWDPTASTPTTRAQEPIQNQPPPPRQRRKHTRQWIPPLSRDRQPICLTTRALPSVEHQVAGLCEKFYTYFYTIRSIIAKNCYLRIAGKSFPYPTYWLTNKISEALGPILTNQDMTNFLYLFLVCITAPFILLSNFLWSWYIMYTGLCVVPCNLGHGLTRLPAAAIKNTTKIYCKKHNKQNLTVNESE